jgi:tyrosine decarboxylase/aspartate 1-decarboxylase
MLWYKQTDEQIKQRIIDALAKNINYKESSILGLPGTQLDDRVFSQEAHFVKDAPFLSTLVQNPNHIGCHTLGESEHYFAGTQALEREVIHICAEEMFKAAPNSIDGYIAAGGTEANLQSIWIYRNYFEREKGYQSQEIALIYSSDSHYSMAKGANIFNVQGVCVPVDSNTRRIDKKWLTTQLHTLKAKGVKGIILVANLMTTMFGSVDHLSDYLEELDTMDFETKVHVDGAYGGFYYPFANDKWDLHFENERVNSITLDAHKMVQAPYGTGIFLIRKGWMKYATTKEASYVEGSDCTLSGSRSGANAVAIWMIFAKYGAIDWTKKMNELKERTVYFTQQLDNLGVLYFREAHSNIVTLPASEIPDKVVQTFGLVPDNHEKPNWYKVVVMEHVTPIKLQQFLSLLGQSIQTAL